MARCEQYGVCPFPLPGRSGTVDDLKFHAVSEGQVKGERASGYNS